MYTRSSSTVKQTLHSQNLRQTTPKLDTKQINKTTFQSKKLHQNFVSPPHTQGQLPVSNGSTKKKNDFNITPMKSLMITKEVLCDVCRKKTNVKKLECNHQICSSCMQLNNQCPTLLCRTTSQSRNQKLQERLKNQNNCCVCLKKSEQIYTLTDCGCKICYQCIKHQYNQILKQGKCQSCGKIINKDGFKSSVQQIISACSVCDNFIENQDFFQNTYCNHKYCQNCMKYVNNKEKKCLHIGCYEELGSKFQETKILFEKKQFQYTQQKSYQISKCSDCEKENQFIFKNIKCQHQYCYDCIRKNNIMHYCGIKGCNSSMDYIGVRDFKMEVEEKLKLCSICYKSYDNLYENSPYCKHKYCLNCIQKSQYHIACLLLSCNSKIDANKLEEFYMNEQSRLISLKLNVLELQCSQCNHSNKIEFENTIDYFKCEKCKSSNCYEHYKNKQKCFCFCPKCSRKTQTNKNKGVKFCQECRYFYCDKCANTGKSDQYDELALLIQQHQCFRQDDEERKKNETDVNNETLNQSLTTNDTKFNDNNSMVQKTRNQEKIYCPQCQQLIMIEEQQKSSLKCLQCKKVICFEHRNNKEQCYCFCKYCQEPRRMTKVQGTQILTCTLCKFLICSSCKFEQQSYQRILNDQVINRHVCKELDIIKQSSFHSKNSTNNDKPNYDINQSQIKVNTLILQDLEIKQKEEKECLFKCNNKCKCQQQYCSICLTTITSQEFINQKCQQHFLCLNCVVVDPKNICVFCQQCIYQQIKPKDTSKKFMVYTINPKPDYKYSFQSEYLKESNYQLSNYNKFNSSSYSRPLHQTSTRYKDTLRQ